MSKLSSKRKIAGLLIILVGAVSSIFILNQDSNGLDTQNKEKENQGELLSFESLVSEAKTNNGGAEQGSNDITNEDQNLTDNLASSFASNVVSNENLNITEEQEDQLVEQSFSDAFSYNTFGNEDLKISASNSDQAKIKYIEKIDKDLNDVFEGFKGETATTTITKFLQNQNSEPIDYLISHIPTFIDRLLETEVPPSFAEIHVDLLNVWQKKLNIYSAIKNYQEDSVKAIVGIKEFENAAKKDLNIQSELINTYNNLTNEN